MPAGAPTHQHLHWGADALQRALQPLLPGIGVEVLARTDSTNTRLLERVRHRGDRRSGDLQPQLLVAEQQTQGRGRLGRDWHSAPGHSLTFSLALPLAPADWSGLSLAVGVALAEALDPGAGDAAPCVMIKWPNDLWLHDAGGGGRKLAGVLIETATQGAHRVCIVGVGLNVLPLAADGLASGYACLHEIDADAGAPQALARVAVPLAQALLRFERDGFAPFAAGFARRDLLRGRHVATTAPQPLDGVAEGVDARGALLVRAGSLHAVASGEVSVRLQGDPC